MRTLMASWMKKTTMAYSHTQTAQMWYVPPSARPCTAQITSISIA